MIAVGTVLCPVEKKCDLSARSIALVRNPVLHDSKNAREALLLAYRSAKWGTLVGCVGVEGASEERPLAQLPLRPQGAWRSTA